VSRPAPLSLGELIEHWTLRADEIDLVAVKPGEGKLAFALLLRFYGRFGRFPRNRGELHPDAVEFMARAVKADPAELAGYDWSGRTIKRHRHEIRAHFGFRLSGRRGRRGRRQLGGVVGRGPLPDRAGPRRRRRGRCTA
jgi:hypothetical protein